MAVKGLGTLKAVVLPAFTSADGNVILPPTRSIYFEADENCHDDSLLVSSVMKKAGVEQDYAECEISKFVGEFRNALQSHGMYIAGRLGNFYSKKGRVEFKANRNTSAFNPYEVFETRKFETENNAVPVNDTMWGLKRKTMALVGALATFATAFMA